jgi:hypothetical protein
LNKEYPLMQHFEACTVEWRDAEHAHALAADLAALDKANPSDD